MAGVSSIRPHEPPVEIYCDESLNRGGYDLIGGLWIEPPKARRLRRIIGDLRERFNHYHEFKWTKASGTELTSVYKSFAKNLMDQIWAARARFNCIVLPRDVIDYDTYHDGDHELGYYKFIHWLVRKRIEPGESYIIYLDQRTTRKENRLSELQDVLNNCGRRDHGLGYDCVRDVQARPSREDDLLQAADVLLGAVGFHYAGAHRDPKSSRAKCELADRIAKGIRKPDLTFASHQYEERFNIWRFNPAPDVAGEEQREKPPRP